MTHRLGYLLLWFGVLILAPPTYAQDEPTPDTLDWRGYVRLEIGNAWEYEIECDCPGGYSLQYEFREVNGDTLIEGVEYFIYTRVRFDESLERNGVLRDYIRYDTTARRVLAYRQQNGHPAEHVWPSDEACDLGAAFNSVVDCPLVGSVHVSEGQPSDSTLGGLELPPTKQFFGPGLGVSFTYGSGSWQILGDVPLGYEERLTYVRIGGNEYGSSRVLTSSPAWKLEDDRPVDVSAFPNPADVGTTITYYVRQSGPAELNVYDVVGRRILSEWFRSAPGSNKHYVDVRSLSVGVYVLEIRLSSGSIFGTIVIFR